MRLSIIGMISNSEVKRVRRGAPSLKVGTGFFSWPISSFHLFFRPLLGLDGYNLDLPLLCGRTTAAEAGLFIQVIGVVVTLSLNCFGESWNPLDYIARTCLFRKRDISNKSCAFMKKTSRENLGGLQIRTWIAGLISRSSPDWASWPRRLEL